MGPLAAAQVQLERQGPALFPALLSAALSDRERELAIAPGAHAALEKPDSLVG